ncbi:MAG: hypothetical protein ACO3MB_07825, partial [Saprospiraceae bacterium]
SVLHVVVLRDQRSTATFVDHTQQAGIYAIIVAVYLLGFTGISWEVTVRDNCTVQVVIEINDATAHCCIGNFGRLSKR